MFKKLIYIAVLLLVLLFCIYFYNSITPKGEVIKDTAENTSATNSVSYEAVELKTQADFKLLGKGIYLGTGFEPGFNIAISLAGTKFGVDLVSQYGDTHYVGYLDLINQSTSTKVFSGKMLNKENKVVDAEVKITNKVCILPSGKDVPLTIDIKAGTEKLNGCANVVN